MRVLSFGFSMLRVGLGLAQKPGLGALVSWLESLRPFLGFVGSCEIELVSRTLEPKFYYKTSCCWSSQL